jgi:hypothetical protein
MRRSPTYAHTTDPETALALAQALATMGRFMAPAASDATNGATAVRDGD